MMLQVHEGKHLARQHGLFNKAAATQQHHVTGGFAALQDQDIPGDQLPGRQGPHPPPLHQGHNAPLVDQLYHGLVLTP